jgi:hypothetical protein
MNYLNRLLDQIRKVLYGRKVTNSKLIFIYYFYILQCGNKKVLPSRLANISFDVLKIPTIELNNAHDLSIIN